MVVLHPGQILSPLLRATGVLKTFRGQSKILQGAPGTHCLRDRIPPPSPPFSLPPLLPVFCSPPSFSQTHISPTPHLPSSHHIPRPPHPFHCPHPLKRLYLFAYHLSLTWNSVHHLLGFYSSVSSWEFQLYEGRQSSFIPFILSGIWEVLRMSD